MIICRKSVYAAAPSSVERLLGGLGHHIGNGGHLDHVGVGAVAPDMSVHDAAAADQRQL